MALDIDGFVVLRSISAHAYTFPDLAAEAAKAARALVVKQITNKSINLQLVRDIRKAIGSEAFNLILDGMKDSRVKSLASKLDKNHPELKTSNPQWRRQQVRALADGSIEPTAKPTPPPKAKRPPKARKMAKRASSEQPELLSYSSAGATRKRA